MNSTPRSGKSRSGRASRGSSRPSSCCIFAVPFAFGPLRSAGAGARTVIGIMVGVLFVLLTQTLENSGQVYGLESAAGRLGTDGIAAGWSPRSRSGGSASGAAAAPFGRACAPARSCRLRPAGSNGIQAKLSRAGAIIASAARNAPSARSGAAQVPERRATGQPGDGRAQQEAPDDAPGPSRAGGRSSVSSRILQAFMPSVWPLRVQHQPK